MFKNLKINFPPTLRAFRRRTPPLRSNAFIAKFSSVATQLQVLGKRFVQRRTPLGGRRTLIATSQAQQVQYALTAAQTAGKVTLPINFVGDEGIQKRSFCKRLQD